MKKKTMSLVIACLLAAMLCGGCGYHGFKHAVKTDDSISKALSKSVDSKWMRYRGKTVYDAETATIYKSIISREEKEGIPETAAGAINAVLMQEKTQNKIFIYFEQPAPDGVDDPLFSLKNYYQKDSSLADYEKLQFLSIIGTVHGSSYSIYNNPETYKNIPDIRHLKVREKIQKTAEEKGIDWHEYWPELEVIEVYPEDSRSEALCESLDVKQMQYWGKTTEGGGIAPSSPPYSFTYTVHISREQKGLAEAAATAVNEVLVQEHTQNRVCVVFTETIPAGGTEELFRLQNYYREDASLADYAKLRCLIISGTDQGDPDSIYNAPETYKNFPDIRYLKVSEKIQKAAEEKGIDWYEYWPELEEVEVY